MLLDAMCRCVSVLLAVATYACVVIACDVATYACVVIEGDVATHACVVSACDACTQVLKLLDAEEVEELCKEVRLKKYPQAPSTLD